MAATHQAVVRGAVSNRQVEPVVLQDDGTPTGWAVFGCGGFAGAVRYSRSLPAIGRSMLLSSLTFAKPASQHFQHPSAQQRRLEQAAVEQHDVGPRRIMGTVPIFARAKTGLSPLHRALLHLVLRYVPVGRQEGGEIPGNRRVRRKGQAELLKARLPARRLFVQPHAGKEPLDQQVGDLLASHLRLEPPADQPGARAGQTDREPLGGVFSQQRFLDRAAGPHQNGPLPGLQFHVFFELPFDEMRQGHVQVVAAQQQVVADGHAVELDFSPLPATDANQREVRRSAADVAHQYLLARRNPLLPVVGVGVEPGVKGGLRLLDQQHPPQPGQRRRLDRELAGHLVERGRQGEHEVLFLQRIARMAGIPGVSGVSQIAGTDLDGRKPRHVLRRVPRQQRRRPVHARVTQPRLRRADQPARRQHALVAGKQADCTVGLGPLPGTSERPGAQLAGRGLVMEGRQRFAGFHLAGGHDLWDRKRLDPPGPLGRIDVGRRRVRRAQIEAHHVACRLGRCVGHGGRGLGIRD